MKIIKAKYNIHNRVFVANYKDQKIDDFIIEIIYVSVELRYSGSGGQIGECVSEYYSDEAGDYIKMPVHRLFSTREQALEELKKHQELFPTKICSECGTCCSVDTKVKEK